MSHGGVEDRRGMGGTSMRLIDANALISYMDECSKESRFRVYYGYAKSFIDDAPTIDAVPVVRCRECKHRYTENCPMYFHDSYWHEGYEEYVDDDTDHTEDDYFCPKGERKEGAE